MIETAMNNWVQALNIPVLPDFAVMMPYLVIILALVIAMQRFVFLWYSRNLSAAEIRTPIIRRYLLFGKIKKQIY